MIFTQRDITVLRLLGWCQYVWDKDLNGVATDTELYNLMALGLVKRHEKSGALILTGKGHELLQDLIGAEYFKPAMSYHDYAIQRRLRLSGLAITAYRGGVEIFKTVPEELSLAPTLFLSTVTRGRGSNPWGSTRVAAIAHLGNVFYAMHYVCPGIGKVALIDELSAFSNQTARFRKAERAFIFAGDSYRDVLTELERPPDKDDAKLLSYGGVYRCLQMPVHLLSCDSTGAVQLQIMAVPNYRTKLTRAALKSQYHPPPPEVLEWDAIFQGAPFVLAADMDLRRVDAAIRTARAQGHRQIAMAGLEGQAERVLFPRYRDVGLARVFVLTADAIKETTGRKPVPYSPPHTQFTTSKGDVVDAPPVQTHRKTGRSP